MGDSACKMHPLIISAIAIPIVFVFLIAAKKIFSFLVSGLLKVMKVIGRPNPVIINLHREVGELRRATLQITKDWSDLTTLLRDMREQQSGLAARLDSDLDGLSDALQSGVRLHLEEECVRNDQRFSKVGLALDRLREDVFELGLAFRKDQQRPKAAAVDGWSQTDREAAARKRTSKEGLAKGADDSPGDPHESARNVVSVIKRALAEFLKEAKRHLSLERDEVISDMRVIFSQMSEDREDLKQAVECALNTAAHQTQRSFEQFGLVGKEAMKCIVALNEKSENNLATRFQDSSEKLKNIFDLLKNLNFDVVSIKQTLDNIDGQFDEIYRKLELGCQKNNENCEEAASRLQKTAEDWNEKSINLDQSSKQLAEALDKIRTMLGDLNNVLSSRSPEAMGTRLQTISGDIVKSDGNVSTATEVYLNKNMAVLEQNSGFESFGLLSTLVQVCFSKLASLSDQIDTGSTGIKQSVDNLLQKLHTLTVLVETSVESLKSLHLDGHPPENSSSSSPQHKHFQRELKEFIGDIVSLDSATQVSEIAAKYEKLKEDKVQPGRKSTPAANLAHQAKSQNAPKSPGSGKRSKNNPISPKKNYSAAKTAVLTVGCSKDTPKSSKHQK